MMDDHGDARMRTLIVLTVAAALWMIPYINSAQAQSFIIGIGNFSCANWLLSPASKRDGQNWIGGYWSGLNVRGGNSAPTDFPGFWGALNLPGYPGSRSDPPAILGEVEKICVAEPSTNLRAAVERVFLQFIKDGK